ncbi:hypothetical protein GGR53DRAFT_153799 [Hypoxylon sp. FL1150]|nr:hypothetical protein GGR53DRAFT_153799 [Hypoxylon sp. FL1150]
MFFKSRVNKPEPLKQVQSTIEFKYHDGERIIRGLDNVLGKGKYLLKCRNDRWIVFAERELSGEEKSKLESDAHVHYSP